MSTTDATDEHGAHVGTALESSDGQGAFPGDAVPARLLLQPLAHHRTARRRSATLPARGAPPSYFPVIGKGLNSGALTHRTGGGYPLSL